MSMMNQGGGGGARGAMNFGRNSVLLTEDIVALGCKGAEE